MLLPLSIVAGPKTPAEGEQFMSQSIAGNQGVFAGSHARTAAHSTPSYQAYQILHFAFVAAPVIAGLDKFFHLLVNWDMYLAPQIARLSPIGGHNLMLAIGVIEIVAGLLVAFKPRIGAVIVAVWLWGIIINLLLIPSFFDIALRDFGLSLGALALARLSKEFSS
jgi:uncharacterized membrane protein HdeD (DUF308 family)